MEKELISVIIPVYNVQSYLEKCLNSVLKQTYSKLQIILVDDGSTDRSGEICDEYSIKDSRISVIHTKNKGMSAARNSALEKAEGSFIAFVDSDDYIDCRMLEILYLNATYYGADISSCGYDMIYGHKIRPVTSGVEVQVYTKEQALENMFFTDGFGVNAWNKLYRKSLFDNVRYPENQWFEDINTTHKLIMKSNKLVYTPDTYYSYVQHKDSINGKSFKNKKFNQRLYDMEFAVDEVCDVIKKAYPDSLYRLEEDAVNYYLRVINVIIRTGAIKSEQLHYEKLRKKVITILDNHINFSRLGTKKKIQYKLFRKSERIYKTVVHLHK